MRLIVVQDAQSERAPELAPCLLLRRDADRVLDEEQFHRIAERSERIDAFLVLKRDFRCHVLSGGLACQEQQQDEGGRRRRRRGESTFHHEV